MSGIKLMYNDDCFHYPIIKPSIKLNTSVKKYNGWKINEEDFENTKRSYTTTGKLDTSVKKYVGVDTNHFGHFDTIKRTYSPVEY